MIAIAGIFLNFQAVAGSSLVGDIASTFAYDFIKLALRIPLSDELKIESLDVTLTYQHLDRLYPSSISLTMNGNAS